MEFTNSNSLGNEHRLALWFEKKAYSYAELWSGVESYSQALAECGCGAGQTVCLWLDNQPSSLFIYLGLLYLETIVVWCNRRLTVPEIHAQMHLSGATVLITDREMASNDRYKIIHPAHIETQLSINRNANATSLNFSGNSRTIFFTSGTSGTPKAVPLSLINLWHSSVAVNSFLAVKLSVNHQQWLLCLPFYHVGGMAIVWRSLLSGGAIYLVNQFRADQIIEIVQSGNINLISLVPTMLKRLINHGKFADSLTAWQAMGGIFLGGARADHSLLKECLRLKLPILVTYGMTELASQISILDLSKHPERWDSVGQVLPHIDLQIQDGQIMVKSPACADGLPLISGYFATGDLGTLDGDGYLYLHDRRTDLIISGGENISPSELEAILIKHPRLTEVCVVGKADPEWGQVPAVIYKNNSSIDPQISLEEVQRFCLDHQLARYKLPKHLYPLPEIPLTASGKYDRQALKDLVN
jgi:O-succinylbenzoic acid--CoA ligase